MSRPLLVVIDGSKALRRAVLDVFDQPVIQRCQLHKVRNVKDKLPERLRRTVERRMRQAYRADSAPKSAQSFVATMVRTIYQQPSAGAGGVVAPGCSRRRSNSVASTGTCTCPRYAPPSSVMPLRSQGVPRDR